MRSLTASCIVPIALAIALAVIAVSGCARVVSDPSAGQRGLVIYTDDQTGCQYVGRPGQSSQQATPLTPRMEPTGTQVCGNSPLVR
jgi:hypothetical protein